MTKTYVRLQSIALPNPLLEKSELRSLICSRKSFRDFTRSPIKKSDLSQILYYSAGIIHPNENKDKPNSRAYPSAGAKYPLELYVLVQYGKDLKPGIYHYQPETHSLDVLLSPVLIEETKGIWLSQPWFRQAAAVVVMTAVFHRTTDKYGDAGSVFPYLEAGHIAENIYLITQLLKIGCCAIGQMNTHNIVSLLDIDIKEEIPLYYVAIGN